MGLGLFGGGVGAARHLVAAGYAVTVTDLRDEDALAASVRELDGLDVRFRLGAHDEADFAGADLVVVNPAVPPGNRFVAAARAAGVRLDTEIGLFVRACRAPVVGVTGTAGKSTTSALIARCLAPAAERRGGRALLGGNIGRSLLAELEHLGESDAVVLELSSFQLHRLRDDPWRPDVGVVTNIVPNHLDWHGTSEAPRAAKCGVAPRAGGVLVACADDAGARSVAEAAECAIVWTSGGAPPESGDAVAWSGSRLVQREDGNERDVLVRGDVRLLGEHAPWNVASAAAAALAAGAEPADVRDAVRGFAGLPHRLCPIGDVDGVRIVDDSKSTTPEAAAGALRAFAAPVVLLAGGYDKGLDPAPLVAEGARSAKAVVCFGATGESLAAALRAAGARDACSVASLEDAVAAARERLAPGDVLLLSPGHASWDQFENYRHRARVFATAVGLEGTGGDGPKG